MDTPYIPDLMLRGATIGLLMLSAIVLLRAPRHNKTKYFGVLFALGTAAYTVETSMILGPDQPLLFVPVTLFAVLNCVFFWWFAMALLDDDFEWRGWLVVPLALAFVLFVIRVAVPDTPLCLLADAGVQMLTIGLAMHVLWLALTERRNDLCEKRRKFRVVFSVVVGLMCLGVAAIRLGLYGAGPPLWLTTMHAAELFLLTLGFCAWILQPTIQLFDQQTNGAVAKDNTLPYDELELKRLQALMQSGFYRRDALSIKELAEELEIPEHRLRQLINQRLGFRNFTAYLNSHRLADARSMLADPEHARRQITQIAFDLGYGSITPFNRAFKAREGMTPTEFRRQALTKTAAEVKPSTAVPFADTRAS